MGQSFGDWLREARASRRLSMEELSQRAGCSKTYISNLERGTAHPITGAKPRPREGVVRRLALALGVREDEALLAAGYAPQSERVEMSDHIWLSDLNAEMQKVPHQKQPEVKEAIRQLVRLAS